MVVAYSKGTSIWSSYPELVSGLLLPECQADGAAFLDDSARLRPAVNGEDAHWNFVNAGDPDHGELAGLGAVECIIIEPERASRGGFVLDSFETDCPGSV